MNNPLTPVEDVHQRFPELGNFELEIGMQSGWTTFRADEHELAAKVLNCDQAILVMLTGAYAYVEKDDKRYQCRLTPKAWLSRRTSHD